MLGMQTVSAITKNNTMGGEVTALYCRLSRDDEHTKGKIQTASS